MLQSTSAKLRIYTGETIQVVGELSVKVEYYGQNAVLPLLVVQKEGPSLIGRNWLIQIHLDWKNVFSVNNKQLLEDLLNQHSTVFQDELGTVKDVKMKLYVKEDSTPKFSSPAPSLLLYARKFQMN